MAATPISTILIETTLWVDFLRGSTVAADYLDAARGQAQLVCSVITAAELIVGCRTRSDIRTIDQLLARLLVEPITADDSVRAWNWFRKFFCSHGVGFHDCLLAATAVRLRIPVVTLNEKHFRSLPGVQVIRPY